ncbi:MAG: response regulator [Paucibacter sp.]|nr:response regulator [Roseateles sp.]
MSNEKGKILVVDDDRLVLATLTYGLAQAGFEVIDADNGDDAILLAREHRPELALLDIRMEGLSGFDVAAYLREYLHIPFMFLSAFADEETVAKVKELGAVAYLVKPLDIHQIVPAVEAAFANRKQTQQPPVAAALTEPPKTVLDELAPVAVGVLMHRYSLSRQDALTRLQKLAAAEGRELELQARLLVEAVEMLAQPANVK